MKVLTPRLELWQMTASFLDACLAGTLIDTDFAVPADWLQQQEFMQRRLGQYRDEPGYEAWGVWAILLPESRQMIGHTGFHTAPHPGYLRPYVSDAVEFGYSIYPEFRLHGYATEAARGLIEWASCAHEQRRFVMSIAPDNTASQAIARKLGFVKISQWQDDEDGLEEVFLLEVAAPTNSSGG